MIRLSRLAASLAVIIALAGCAVTKIDVDVYKGPLANEKEVQLEQMAVMAVGTRPILLRLRDRLEEEERRKISKTNQYGDNFFNARKRYGNGYGTCIREDGKDTGKKWREFRSDDARRVNAILCLYEDRAPYRGKLHARAWKALRAYRSAWENFRGKGENRDWKTFQKAMYCEIIRLKWPKSDDCDNKALPNNHPLKTICQPSGKCCNNCQAFKAFEQLVKAYDQFLDKEGPKSGASGNIRVATDGLLGLGLWEDNSSLSSLMKRFTGFKAEGANWNYRFLSNEKLVEAHAELLFPTRADKKKNEFVHTVTLIAKSFRTVRESLRELLQINLDMLIASAQDPEEKNDPHLGRRARTTDSIVLLTGRANFRALICSVQEKPDWFSERVQKLAELAGNVPGVLSENREDLEIFKRFLISELRRRPLETATALREGDLVFPSPDMPTELYESANLTHLKDSPRREFGLSRVIQEGQEKPLIDPIELQENLGPGATGLAGGRLNDGLERMINDYLNKDDHHKRHGGKDTSPKIHRLRDALVRFAQKMLFVADYDNLLSRENQNDSAEEINIREYTQVLQAVGNSILVQANELQARETHGELLKENADRAKYEARRVLDGTPQQTIEAIIGEFKAKRIELSKKLNTAQKEFEIALTNLRNVTKELNLYVTQNLQPGDETTPLPKPSELIGKEDGSLGLKRTQVSETEKALCDTFTDHALKVMSARLTLILNKDQGADSQKLYERISNHKPGKSCNPLFEKAKKILESRDQTQIAMPEIQEHAERVRMEIETWEPKSKDDMPISVNGPAVKDRIVDFLKKLQKEIHEQGNPDYIRLNEVITYLPTIELGGIKSDKPIKVFDQIKNNLIGTHWKSVYKKLSNSFRILEKKQNEMQREQTAFNKLKASYKEKYEPRDKANKKRKDFVDEIEKLRMVISALKDLKPSIIDKVSSANLPNIPLATFLLLKTTVAKKLATAKIEKNNASENDRTSKEKVVAKWQSLWDALDGMNPPTSVEIAGQDDFKDDKTSREVLDRLISVLNYEYIETIKRYGMPGRAVHVKEALRAAYRLRTRLVFIRPASSYLRSSYPAASLQNDPGLGWRNELGRHALKSVPLLGECLTNNCRQGGVDLALLSQIDRQFWQNINSIRVGGAGRTNYVLVQDDIGNWYVKGYSADPQDIIRSANSLGQFALGGQLGTDLVNLPETGTESVPAPQPTALEAVFDKYNKEYERATEEMFKDVKAALESLPGEVQNAWTKNPKTSTVREEAVVLFTSVEAHLKKARTVFDKDDADKSEQVAQRPARIVMALRAMDRFRDSMNTSIRNNVSETLPNKENNDDAENSNSNETGTTTAITKEERKTAINALIADLDEVINARIELLLKRREDTAKAFEKAIVFVGEILGKEPTPANEKSAP